MFEMSKCGFDKMVIRYASPVERPEMAMNMWSGSHVVNM